MNKRQRGFTLFELLVSISIIGILTALVSVSFSAAQKKARDARRMEDMNAIKTAAEQFYSLSADYSYPLTAGPWTVGTQVILERFPTDPKGSGYAPYSYTAAAGGYCACALLENPGAANSGSACDFNAGTKTHFCVKNQQ